MKKQSYLTLTEKGFIFIDIDGKLVWCKKIGNKAGLHNYSEGSKKWIFDRIVNKDEVELAYLLALPESEYKKYF